jgi:ATP-binding cassette subfamily B protein
VTMLNGIGALCQATEPWFVRELLDSAIPRRDHGACVFLIELLGLAYILRVSSFSIGSWRGFTLGQEIALRLRERVLQVSAVRDDHWHESIRAGEVRVLLEDDVAEISTFVTEVQSIIVRMMISTGAALLFMRLMNLTLMWSVVLFINVFLIINLLFRRHLDKSSRQVREVTGSTGGFIIERLHAMSYFRYLNLDRLLGSQILEQWRTLFSVQRRYRKWEIGLSILISATIILATLATLLIGTSLVLKGMVSIGELVAFYAYLQRIFEPLGSTYELFGKAGRVRVGWARIDAALSFNVGKNQLSPATIHKERVQIVKLSSVSIHFGKEPVIEDVSLDIYAGDIVGLTGPSGSGKTSMARVLVRALAPSSGTIYFEGRDISTWDMRELRSAILYLPQSPVILTGTILDNLLGDSNAESAPTDLTKVAEICGLQAIGKGTDGRFAPHHHVSPNTLSGGEKQRIALARALLRSPRILILDEATSALDERSEREIMDGLLKELSPEVVIVISHRHSTTQRCSRIVRLSKGRLHEEWVTST